MTVNFAKVLDDLAAERISTSARLARWAADVQAADGEAQRAYVDERAYVAATAIERIGPNLSESDAVVLLAAVYRAIHKSRLGLDHKYWVLAGLSDAINEVLPTVQQQLDMKQLEARR